MRCLLTILPFLLLSGCPEVAKETPPRDTGVDTDNADPVDMDGDGYPRSMDCDDNNAQVNPSAEESCDGADNDCDGSIDEGQPEDAPTWYVDTDGDGYGEFTDSQVRCVQPHGYVAIGGDCDDTDALYNPSALESDCTDPNDYNCDGSVGYADADNDTFPACQDCDDTESTVNDNAYEICDGLDNDCDGDVDSEDSDVIGGTIYYADADGDGSGGDQFSIEACEAPAGYVTTQDDCNDLDPLSYPGATEICDEEDNNCDGTIDEGLSGTWYADVDSDGYGDPNNLTTDCDAPLGFVTNGDDCDDLEPTSHPNATEVCDEADNDCDGNIDEGVGNTWYADSDNDGFGNGSTSIESCEAPSNYVANALDCDDFSATTNPSSYEICDGTDNDCDGSTDESDAINASTWYIDTDSDGYGANTTTVSACTQPSGYAGSGSDCNDADSAINPGASETCDSLDNDCDGSTDESDAVDATTWYADADNDGFGSSDTSATTCVPPNGYVLSATDCDDTNNAVNIAATELCDGIDNDCDNSVDESDAQDASTWYPDVDNDGFGDASNSGTTSCSAPTSMVSNNTDCDDSTSGGSINPNATETWYDGTDSNCDGADDYDQDGDGYVSDSHSGDDCDDTDSTVNPGATEVNGDGVDSDCNGSDIVCTTGLIIIVEGISGDIEVCTTCSTGQHSCQAEQICTQLTSETCQHQNYDCATGTLGSWYPPSHGGSSNFNFAYAYDFHGSDYGNICDGANVSSQYGIGATHTPAGTGHWYRQ